LPPAPRDAAGTLLVDYAAQFVRDKTGLQPDTRTRYANQVIMLAAELDAVVAADPTTPGERATVENLTTRHVSRWINERESQGSSPKTIRNWHGLLYQVLQGAADEGLRKTNPCVRTGRALPRRDGARTAEQKVFLTEHEFGLIADAMWPGLPDPARGGELVAIGSQDDRELLLAAVGTGARWSELTALTVADVALQAVAEVRIERAWKTNGVGEYARRDAEKKYLGAPKTIKGRRRIRVGRTLAELLAARIQGRERQEYLFHRPDGRPVNQGYFYRHRWLPAVALAQRNGMIKNPRFHDLRHTYAAWLISAGVPLPEVQQRLGHESIQTTVDVYGGLLESAGELADAAIDRALTSRGFW
jgi:integrase